MADKICMLNRKPYWDRNGFYRVRTKCCGKRETGCTLLRQPEGTPVSDHRGNPIVRRAKKPNFAMAAE